MGEEDDDSDESNLQTATETGTSKDASPISWTLPLAGFAFVAIAAVVAFLVFVGPKSPDTPEKLVKEPSGGGDEGVKTTAAQPLPSAAIPTLPMITAAQPTTGTTQAPTTQATQAATEATTKRTTKTMTTPTTTPTTTSTTTSTTTRTTTTTTTMAPLWKKLLLCSFDATFVPSLVFPEDGLCDINFFQALEPDHVFLKGRGGRYKTALDAFLNNAAKQNKTEHGVGLDYKYNIETLNILKNPVANKTIKELWGKKIYHWAYLNAEVYDLNIYNMTRLFEILKEIKWMIDQAIKPTRPHYIVYTGSLLSAYRSYYETDAMLNVMWLDGLAVCTHFVDDDRLWIYGRIVPPTFWSKPKNVKNQQSYGYTMGTAHNGLKNIADDDLNNTAFYFTAAMAGRRYIPEEEYAFLGKIELSDERFFVDITDYCKNDKYKYGFENKDVIGAYYSSQTERRFITFDDTKALGMKFCKGKKDLFNINYGFVVYNVEMDDPTNKCGKGAYPRVKFLRKLAEFFRDNFTTPENVTECLKLTERSTSTPKSTA